MKKLLIFTISLLSILPGLGNIRYSHSFSVDSAMIAAEHFLQDRQTVTGNKTRAAVCWLYPVEDFHDGCYAFNIEGGGFVIVGGNSTPVILGYADTGNIDMNDIQEGIFCIVENNPSFVKSSINQTIAPLLSTNWGQREPFNTFCPNNFATGCVATAMAQVMAYYRWPQSSTTSIPAYSDYASLAPMTFDWDLMYDDYESQDETGEVARLMLYCGMSVETNYGSSSTARESLVPVAFRNYFNYDAAVRRVVRTDFTAYQWDSLLTAELEAAHPVIYRGVRSTGSAHEFVVDGRDADGFYHINWGWQGRSNGWFRLVAANPYYTGTGGGSGHDGYSLQQSAVVGICPDTGGQAPASGVRLSVEELNIYLPTLLERASSGQITTKVQCVWANHTEEESSQYYGIGVYQGEKLVEAIKLGALNFKAGTIVGRRNSGVYADYKLSFGKGLSGEVRLVPIYGNGIPIRWKPAVGSERRWIGVKLDDNYAQLTLHPEHRLYISNVEFIPMTINDNGLQHVEATIRNYGEEFDGRLCLSVNGIVVSVNGFMLASGAETSVDFIYEPSEGVQNFNIGLSQDEDIYPGYLYEGTAIVNIPTFIAPVDNKPCAQKSASSTIINQRSYSLNGVRVYPSSASHNNSIIITEGNKTLWQRE